MSFQCVYFPELAQDGLLVNEMEASPGLQEGADTRSCSKAAVPARGAGRFL
jgi:hypothetical protein